LEVQEADPWFAVKKTPELAVKLTPDAPTYAVAVGLALRKE
jgi:Tfp pilus assembly PilM family ATPase